MAKTRRASTRTPRRPATLVLTAAILVVGCFAVSTIFLPSHWDEWRTPKELVFRLEAILLAVVALYGATSSSGSWRERAAQVGRAEWAICGGIALWTAITAITSSNRAISADSLVTVFAALAIYLSTRIAAPEIPFGGLFFGLAAAMITALLVTLQEFQIWNPIHFVPTLTGHLRSTGLIGNPNDVGTYLAPAALAACVGAVVARGTRRWLLAVCTAILIVGILASSTRTAIIAIAAGLFLLTLTISWRRAAILAGTLVAFALISVALPWSLGINMRRFTRGFSQRRLDRMTSDRVIPFLTAFEMARKHPILGVGPGCFKFNFMDERIEVVKTYPYWWVRGWPQNFSEAHNDHLQVSAEEGFPAYALFLAAVAVVALPLRRRELPDDAPVEQRFARMARIPLGGLFFVICLAQFPLQIAAPRLMFITFAALVNGWDARHE